MNILELMENNGYHSIYDLTIPDLIELGELFKSDAEVMSIGALMELVENLEEDAIEYEG